MGAPIHSTLSRLGDLRARIGSLATTRDMASASATVLRENIAQARARVQMAPRVQQLLEAIQARAHARSIGAYEAILTGLLHDVMRDDALQVRLTASQRAGQPALDIDLLNDGNPEDVLDGNGGAVTNLICAGLRFAVTARAGLRRFLVLDEPDCWLRPDHVPAFVHALSSVCDKAGFQALFITHHPLGPSDFSETTSHIRLFDNGAGGVQADCQLSGTPSEGLTYFRAQNLRTCVDTTLHFGPALTVLSGENNIGKSSIISGIRAIAHGGASDSQIRHGTDEMRLELGVSSSGVEHVVKLSRRRKGSPKVVLQLTDEAGAIVHEEKGSPSSAPEWVTDMLGIRPIANLDPQLLSQKVPVFLLDEPASTRAQVLYVGKEALHLARMFEEQNKQLREDKKTIGQSSLALTTLESKLEKLMGVPALHAFAVEAAQSAERLAQHQAKTHSLQQRLPLAELAWHRAHLKTDVSLPSVPELRDVRGLGARAKSLVLSDAVRRIQPPELPAIPSLAPAEAVGSAASRLARLAHVVGTVRPVDLPAVPQLRDTVALSRVARQLVRAKDTAIQLGSANATEVPALPSIRDLAALQSLCTRLTRGLTARDTALRAQELTDQELAAATQALALLVEQTGNQCPLCHQHITVEHIHGH